MYRRHEVLELISQVLLESSAREIGAVALDEIDEGIVVFFDTYDRREGCPGVDRQAWALSASGLEEVTE